MDLRAYSSSFSSNNKTPVIYNGRPLCQYMRLKLQQRSSATASTQYTSDAEHREDVDNNKLLNRDGFPSLLLHLPDSILLEIFSYLSHQDLGTNVSRVCRKFRRIAHDWTLWRNLRFNSSKTSKKLLDEHVKSLLSRSRHPQEVLLRGQVALTDAAFSLKMGNSTFSRVRRLHLSSCLGLSPVILCSLLSSVLQELVLDYTSADDKLMHVISTLTSSRHSLRYLSLSGCRSITSPGLLQVLTSCTNLENLRLTGCAQAVTDAVLSYISSSCSNLGKLSIAGCLQLTDIGLFTLEKLRKLEALDLSSIAAVDRMVISRIASGSGGVLRKLFVNRCPLFDDVCLTMILAHSCRNSVAGRLNLQQLHAQFSAVSDVGLRVCAETNASPGLVDVSFCESVTELGLLCLCLARNLHTLRAGHVANSSRICELQIVRKISIEVAENSGIWASGL